MSLFSDYLTKNKTKIYEELQKNNIENTKKEKNPKFYAGIIGYPHQYEQNEFILGQP